MNSKRHGDVFALILVADTTSVFLLRHRHYRHRLFLLLPVHFMHEMAAFD